MGVYAGAHGHLLTLGSEDNNNNVRWFKTIQKLDVIIKVFFVYCLIKCKSRDELRLKLNEFHEQALRDTLQLYKLNRCPVIN